MVSSGNELGSKAVAKIAIEIALSDTREQENAIKEHYLKEGVLCAAAEYGGEFLASVMKIVERAVVAAKRENLIRPSHAEEGAVAGATREALTQIMQKAIGLNIGGKIGIARYHDHISVAIFVGIGLLHLNEVAIGLGHRVI